MDKGYAWLTDGFQDLYTTLNKIYISVFQSEQSLTFVNLTGIHTKLLKGLYLDIFGYTV